MSALDKTRQKYLFKWLKQQTKQHRKPLFYSILLGFISAGCIAIQAALLALILQELIILGGKFTTISFYCLFLFYVVF